MSKRNKKVQTNRGMTYVELIVVLSIFAVMSSVVLFNYNKFQDLIDIKNLANDIALKIVQAQKSAMGGVLPSSVQQIQIVSLSTWKPSYGLYFKAGSLTNNSFISFVDLNQLKYYSDSFTSCPGSGECLEKVSITRGNYISNITVFDPSKNPTVISNNLSITFIRPNSEAVFYSNNLLLSNVYYAQITISSPTLVTSTIKVYASGRIQIN